ncbi:BAG domain-containing protein Samui isoform X1 [Microplitis mediator]|uniref:BAG domain-containing protein Samui isoform X1 n=1 Tax=Microplitis mediator TaxID=375433 RepID=UPI0025528292|nr:BAG domain-containing protein Samui isoform X1 [Microplitis mediator]
MSYFFRDRPKFSERLRGKSGDELFQELKQHFDDEDKNFEPSSRNTRDPFDRHAFSRGFPFDDESFSRRDIRSHLDDLAARHPEFAEHLLGPPWGEIPFHGTLRNRRRGSGSNSQQGHPDEDARSQASGSSAASAASGASGVSSHGEPDQIYQQETPGNKIPQYGLRNTVDIGQHRHNMENLEKADRGQRSMSAPPENRQQEQQQPQTHAQQNQNPRFVSRVDITPQYTNQNQSSVPSAQQQQSPQSQSPPQNQQHQQSNVRHIPIFVEGRDEPVISKGSSPTYTRQQSPPRFHQPQFESPHPEYNSSNYQRPSSQFNQHFGGRNRDWPPQYQDPFQDTFDHPTIRKTHQSHSPFRQDDRRRPESPVHARHQHPSHQQPQHQQPQHQQQQQQPKRQDSPKPRKQIVPTDPLEKVAAVQKEINSLTDQVKQWSGTSRKDKQYIYLDEMLTRELIKLDDIETEGKENVRQARKNAIKSIQDSISLLESKAPLTTTTEVVNTEEQQQVEKLSEPMESETVVKEEHEAIPLPSPTKPEDVDPQLKDEKSEPLAADTAAAAVPMETTAVPAEKELADNSHAMEVQPGNTQSALDADNPIKVEDQVNKEEEASAKKEANETRPTKSPKKLKKAKKQTPVSMEPIPLPASEEQTL